MLFNSIPFLFFFPFVVLVYFLIPKNWRWVWLLAASYYFYMCWNPLYAFILLGSTVITYVGGLLMSGADNAFSKKVILGITAVLSIGLLVFFKYGSFIVDNVVSFLNILHIRIIKPEFDLLLPVGISFYTFRSISYLMDVYRGDVEAEKSFGRVALYVSFFLQLAAGPIERAKNMLPQIHNPQPFEYERIKNGLLLMLWGLFQKLVIADRCAMLVNHVFADYEAYRGFQILTAILFFAVQIYCDFAGYSDMAIGASMVLGFSPKQNFNKPYFATSIQDFWRRWHISLSSWFRDYLYIPLGGNRKGQFRKYLNVLIVFLVSGLWHGAAWNYIIWGALHGIYQIIGALTLPFREKAHSFLKINTETFSFRLFQQLVTFCLVCIAWVFFRAPTASDRINILWNMVREWNPWIFTDNSLFNLGLEAKNFRVAIFSIAVLFIVDLFRNDDKMRLRNLLSQQGIIFRWFVYFAALFFIIIFGIYGPAYDASSFIYAGF